ncbi:MAG: hypothetical protein RR360_03785 [Raoultibacter sp.]
MEAITKNRVREIVESDDARVLLAMFDEDPSRVRRFLTRLAFAPDDACHMHTIECFEMLSLKRSDRMPDFFLEIIRRSLWEMNEEGGNVSWSAPEIIGAVIAGSPDRFGDYFSYMFYAAIDEPTFQPSLLAAFERVCIVRPLLVQDFEEQVQALRA